jgi:hypothetical protein
VPGAKSTRLVTEVTVNISALQLSGHGRTPYEGMASSDGVDDAQSWSQLTGR